jgi:hypothetical protein
LCEFLSYKGLKVPGIFDETKEEIFDLGSAAYNLTRIKNILQVVYHR